MTPEQFTKQVRKVVVEDNNSIYQELFDTTDINTVTDEYWKEAQGLYNKLTKDERKVLLKMMIAYDCPMIDLRREWGNLVGGESSAPASARYTGLFRQ